MIRYIQQRLRALQDMDYRTFHCKLMPGVAPEKVLGVRTPHLRKLARELAAHDGVGDFLAVLPHDYYDEMNLHGFIISEIKDYDQCLAKLERFLPFIDNWATCDLLSPKAFAIKKNRERLIGDIARWMQSPEPFTVRFGMEMLMRYYLDDYFQPQYLAMVAAVRHDHYYVRMMQAWFFASALAKQWDAVIPYIGERRLEKWTHNKAIQKAIESYRITPLQKERLRAMKHK